MEIFIFISRTKTPYIESRVRSMGSNAYAVIDELDRPSKRFITYSDEFMESIGWTHHMSQARNRITAWDKATYFAYKSGADYVWICEDDMFWNKPSLIKTIINTDSNADLICERLAESYNDNPNWWHWDKASLLTRNKSYWSASYNQLSRVSRRLLNDIAQLAKQRHRLFFHEIMFATICKAKGYPIDYLSDMKLPLYIKIRWNYPFTKEQVEQLIQEHKYVLLHPVKFLLTVV
jgi:hypothetical protein